MKISVAILALSFLELYHCYENLCRRNSTTVSQSSTYEHLKETLAVDGDLRTFYRYCSHTNINQTVAWFQVDLGNPYSISNVQLYYRKDGLGDSQWQPYRFRQFYLDVSDRPASQTTTAQRTRCYTDNTTHPDVLPQVMDIPCKQTARYVIVETTYDAPEDNPVTGAILEICEIEIYGCETGFYGEECKPCSECKTCDINTGTCDCFPTCINQTCNATNGHCIFGCETGHWGHTCGSVCLDNCQDRKCFQDNGFCEFCKPGYWGWHCNQTCSSFCNEYVCIQSNGVCSQGCITGRYGDICDKMCSPGCVRRSCDSQSGACPEGCHQNWMGTRCDRCNSTQYGLNCTKSCSLNCTLGCTREAGVCYSCVEGKFGEYCDKACGTGCVSGCDQYTGQCLCKLGWQGDRCEDCSSTCINQSCDGTSGHCMFGCETGHWGSTCASSCPDDCQNRKCFQDNGFCGLCKPGYWGWHCNQTCSSFCNKNVCNQSNGGCSQGCITGIYGDICDKLCSPGCVRGSCDSQSGACPEGCHQNWMGTRCDRCDSTHYGINCTKRCSINCTIGCTKDTGVCYSCVDRKFGEYCDKTCGAGCVSGCDQYTGQCKCKPGWQGDRCEDCSPYHYGENCNQDCSSNCLYGTCYKNNGTCKGGCKCSGLEELRQQVQHTQKCNMDAILYVVTGLLCLSLVLNMFFILRKIRCRKYTNRAQEDSTNLHMITRVSCNETYYLNPVDLIHEDPKEEPCIFEEVEGCLEPHYAYIQKTSETITDEHTCKKK